MNTIKLKPQWLFRVIDGVPFLTNEHRHAQQAPEHAALLSRLANGVDSDTLSDEDFLLMEALNSGGYLTTSTDTSLSLWELTGVALRTVQDQYAHCTFKVVDLTGNNYGERFTQGLIDGGMKLDADKPRLTVMLLKTFLDVPQNLPDTIMPVILDRSRVSIGPLTFPWRESISLQVQKNPNYMPSVNYELPKPMQDLQIAWSVVAILRFVALMNVAPVNNIIEFDMVNQSQKRWATS